MAGRLRQGADTGFKDINGDVIHVGERVKDSQGETWLINSWLQAVPDGEGMAIPVKQLRTTLCELYDPELEKTLEEMPTAAEVAEAAEMAETVEEMVEVVDTTSHLVKPIRLSRAEWVAERNRVLAGESKFASARESNGTDGAVRYLDDTPMVIYVEAEEEHPVEAVTIDAFADQQLADELRRRGYDVSASKQITITL